jgi:ABC-type uncharacterized transport system substrate-binding protein
MKKLKKLIYFIIFYITLLAEAQADVAVVRDVVKNPAINDVIKNIIFSIEEFSSDNLHIYTSDDFSDSNFYENTIAIGEKSISKMKNQDKDLSRNIYIGTMNPSNKAYSFAFTPSPKDVVSKIKNFFPLKNQIYIVSNQRYKWLDEHYKEYCNKNNIKVNFYYANSLRASIEHYRNILTKLNDENSILLLTENSLVDEDAILPYILNKSWDDDIAVVSTKASHVKYGILMSLVPDIKNFGKQVNECLINKCNSIDNIDGFNITKPLVNKRMYKHLELDFNDEVIFLE